MLSAMPPAGATQIGLRPEHIEQGQGLPATVRRVEQLGDQTRLHLMLGPHQIITLSDAHTRLSPGDTLAIRPHNSLWFDQDVNRI